MKRDDYKKGLWTAEEDRILAEHVEVHGTGKWSRIPLATGLRRCGKSCRLRWVNYLSPNVKRGNFSLQEEDLIIRLHNLLGNRWSLIAGRVPGRTDNQVKNHWNSHLRKKLCSFDGPRCKNHNALGTTTTTIKSRQRPNTKHSKAGLMASSEPKPSRGKNKRVENVENNASPSSSRSKGPASQGGEVKANNVGPPDSAWLFDHQLGPAGFPNLTGCLGDSALDFILYGR